MSLFFSLFVRCFWLPLFAAAVLSAGRTPQPGRWFAWFVGGVLAGAAAVAWLPDASATLFWFAAMRGALLVLALLLLLTRRALALDVLWFAAGLLGAAPFFAAPVMSAFSTTSVVNTAFILHFAAVLAAAGLSALLALWFVVLRSLVSSRVWRALLVLVVLSWLVVTAVWLGADMGIAAVKLQWLEVSSGLLRWLARTEFVRAWFGYVALAVLAVATLAALASGWLPRRKRLARAKATAVERRLLVADMQRGRRAVWQGAFVFVFALATALFWDLVASKPPALSKATPVELAADGAVHLPIEELKLRDGDLHRFAWVSGEGKVVRFFVIDRFPGEWSPAVVFDACLLCGDTGYAMQGDQVTCIGCGVRLFRPNVGKSGGCNPVPIEGWSQAGGEIVVPRKGLEAGLTLFKAVVELEVIDPVDGSKLKNTTAPHRYSYGTKTYFFRNEENYQRFVDKPEDFVKE
ncbi:Fe-S-containing protein [uncultured Cardiobacterium sp.]|uniref:Fe-S-containing protein n=1 Tax=uncultured Cardiobacterium sp. TaxID=417619 RepID=UPI00260835AB|nr:Fe-S-containing protein [uncultured Cardiobacterium sp.]